MWKRHSKALRAPGRYARCKAGVGRRLPTDHDEISGEVAEQDAALDLRFLCGTGRAEAHVPVRGGVERAPCGSFYVGMGYGSWLSSGFCVGGVGGGDFDL